MSLISQNLGDGHLRVRRLDGKDGISWDELQIAKNDAFGEDAVCVEIFPSQCDVVNDANIRHLWLIQNPSNLPNLKWR